MNDYERAIYRCRELNGLRRRGDFVIVGEALGISAENARRAFERKESKYHARVLDVLEKIIEYRRTVINEKIL
jgi:hypothetical protein